MIARWRVGVMVLVSLMTVAACQPRDSTVDIGIAVNIEPTDGIDMRGSVMIKELSEKDRGFDESPPKPVEQVAVFEEGGKRFALTRSITEGSYLVDITEVDRPRLIPQPATNLMWLESPHFAPVMSDARRTGGAIDTWVANDGKRYFAAVSSYRSLSTDFTSGILQVFGTHPRGGLWDTWADGSFTYLVDGDRIGRAHDVFVYTLQDGVCETSTGCEVFPSVGSAPAVSVNQGEPIYKNYAVVSGSSGVHIYDVTNPKALCNCNSGAEQTALLKGTVLQPSLDLVYYQQGDNHYALSETLGFGWTDHNNQILDISDPTNPDALKSLSEPYPDRLQDGHHHASDVYTVGGRYYAVSIYSAGSIAEDRIQITDITDPTSIVTVGYLADSHLTLIDNPHDVSVLAVSDMRYAVVTSGEGVQIVDITNPAAPTAQWSTAIKTSFVTNHEIEQGSANGWISLDITYTGAVPRNASRYQVYSHDLALIPLLAYPVPTGVDTFQDGDSYYAIFADQNLNGLRILELTEVASEAGNNAKAN